MAIRLAEGRGRMAIRLALHVASLALHVASLAGDVAAGSGGQGRFLATIVLGQLEEDVVRGVEEMEVSQLLGAGDEAAMFPRDMAEYYQSVEEQWRIIL